MALEGTADSSFGHGVGDIINAPVSVCHQQSTTLHLPPPMTSFKGSSYQNHSLFEINVGSDRIVPTVSDFKFSLSLNDDSFQMNESIKEGEKRTLRSGIEPKRLEIKGIRAESPNHCTTAAHYFKSLFIYINTETKMIQ